MVEEKPSLRFAPADCRVGDWVLASAVPEWSTDRLFQPFVPPGQTFTPLTGSADRAQAFPTVHQWIFRACYFIDPAGDSVKIWRRENSSM